MPTDLFNTKNTLKTQKGEFTYFSLAALEKQGHAIGKLPFSIRILLENALRNFDDFAMTKENIETILIGSPKPPTKTFPLNRPGC